MTKYDVGLLQAIKSVPGRAWDGSSWSIPATAAAAELLAASLNGIATAESIEAAAALREIASVLGPAGVPAADLEIEYGQGEFATVRMSEYVREWVEALCTLPKNDRMWDADAKTWKIRKDPETVARLKGGLLRESEAAGLPTHLALAVERVESFAVLCGFETRAEETLSGPRM